MKKSDISLMLGIGIAFGCLVVAFMMEGGSLGGLFSPSALVIILGGIFGALTVSFGISTVLKQLPSGFGKSLSSAHHDPSKVIELFLTFSEKARREGLLSLETDLESELSGKEYDPLIKRGLSLVVDGIDNSAIEKIFETEIEEFEEREKNRIIVFEQAGGFSPTMGIIGTVLGLISVLSRLAEPEKLGESIAVAFVATLYGISFANIVFLPVANKLKAILKTEMAEKKLILQGLLSIQAGDNPRVLKEKLMCYMDEAARGKLREAE